MVPKVSKIGSFIRWLDQKLWVFLLKLDWVVQTFNIPLIISIVVLNSLTKMTTPIKAKL